MTRQCIQIIAITAGSTLRRDPATLLPRRAGMVDRAVDGDRSSRKDAFPIPGHRTSE